MEVEQEDHGENDDGECPVCFDSLGNGETTHSLDCGHRFHVGCILEWAQSSAGGHDSCQTPCNNKIFQLLNTCTNNYHWNMFC